MSTSREITYSTGEASEANWSKPETDSLLGESRLFSDQIETSVAVSLTAGSHRARSRLSVLSKDTWIKGIR